MHGSSISGAGVRVPHRAAHLGRCAKLPDEQEGLPQLGAKAPDMRPAFLDAPHLLFADTAIVAQTIREDQHTWEDPIMGQNHGLRGGRRRELRRAARGRIPTMYGFRYVTERSGRRPSASHVRNSPEKNHRAKFLDSPGTPVLMKSAPKPTKRGTR